MSRNPAPSAEDHERAGGATNARTGGACNGKERPDVFTDRIEERWIAAFDTVFGLCKVGKGEEVAILSETQSRRLNVELAELALLRRGARPFHVTVVSLRRPLPCRCAPPARRPALQGLGPAIRALAASSLVVDVTVEGMLHAPELPDIIADGARLLMISNEHPDALERLLPDPALTERVKAAVRRVRAAKEMRVTSGAGSDLTVALEGAPSAGVWGYCDRPRTVAHWPGGIVVAFPAAGSVQGRLVLDTGDVNLTFKRYLEAPVALTIEDDYVTAIGARAPMPSFSGATGPPGATGRPTPPRMSAGG